MRFQERVVIVTGAARGIGAVTAEAFAREGARVAAVDLDGGGFGAVRPTAHYTAANASVIGFTRHLAAEVAEHGITVHVVAPGTTATERVIALRTSEDTARLATTIPLRRLGDPADIADGNRRLTSAAGAQPRMSSTGSVTSGTAAGAT